MKRKVFALITAFVLIMLLCLSLVACNKGDSDQLPLIKFKDGMTSEEIIKKLGKVKNFTMEGREVTDDVVYNQTICLGEKFKYEKYQSSEESYEVWKFYEGKRLYKIYIEGGEGGISIADYKGYDAVEYCTDINYYIEDIIESVNDGDIVVEDGCLKMSGTSGESGSYEYIYKDFNKTKMPSVPDKYKDYKKMDANYDLIEYELSDDGTYYIVTYIDDWIKSYEIPATYNNTPVKEIRYNLHSNNLEKLTLPTSIVKVHYDCPRDEEDPTLNIVYKGTKEQWAQVENHSVLDNGISVRVTCSDGEYSNNGGNGGNNDADDSGVLLTFTDDMTNQQIIDKINSSDIVAFEQDWALSSYSARYIVAPNYTMSVTNDYEELDEERYYQFYENNRWYSIVCASIEDSSIEITDYTGYDTVDIATFFESGTEYCVELVISYINSGECTVENGSLVYRGAIVFNLYTTAPPMPSVPAEYANYATMSATKEPVEYELSSDETYYILTDIDYWLKSYEVPKTYNGKPVSEISYECYSSNLRSLILSSSVLKLGECDHESDDGELQLIYKGTQEQWAAVENNGNWSTDKGIKVICTFTKNNGGNSGNSYDAVADATPIVFTDDMTADEIVAKIQSSNVLTVKIGNSGDNIYGLWTHYYSHSTMSGETSWSFVEGNRQYSMTKKSSTTNIEIIDYTGYDTIDVYKTVDSLDFVLDLLISLLTGSDQGIEVIDGKLYIEALVPVNIYDVTLQMPAVPSEYASYKTMAANKGVDKYTLSDDETYYALTDIKYILTQYEVDATYNGLPVKEFKSTSSFKYMNCLTLPSSIEKMCECYHSASSGTLYIIYKGTKEQWAQVENHEDWSADNGVKVICTDGEFAE